MERDDSKFESDSGEYQHSSRKKYNPADLPSIGVQPKTAELHSPQLGIYERHTEEKESRRDSCKQKILDARLYTAIIGTPVCYKCIERYAQYLNPEEEGDKMAASNEQGRSKSGKKQEQIKFLADNVIFFQISIRKNSCRNGSRENQTHIKECIGIQHEKFCHLSG